jgi:arylsulfatase
MTGIAENAFINVKGRSFTVTADVDVPRAASGVIIAQAGRFGGWSVYMKDGRTKGVMNYGGLEWPTVSSSQALAPGRHTIRYEFVYDGGKPGSGGNQRMIVDDTSVGEMRVARTMPFAFSGDEGADVGMDLETPVTEDYQQNNNRFTGKILKVTVETSPAAVADAETAAKARAAQIAIQ